MVLFIFIFVTSLNHSKAKKSKTQFNLLFMQTNNAQSKLLYTTTQVNKPNLFSQVVEITRIMWLVMDAVALCKVDLHVIVQAALVLMSLSV